MTTTISVPSVAVIRRALTEFSLPAYDDQVLQIQQYRSEEHTSELQSHHDLVCRLLLEKKKLNHDLSVDCDLPVSKNPGLVWFLPSCDCRSACLSVGDLTRVILSWMCPTAIDVTSVCE